MPKRPSRWQPGSREPREALSGVFFERYPAFCVRKRTDGERTSIYLFPVIGLKSGRRCREGRRGTSVPLMLEDQPTLRHVLCSASTVRAAVKRKQSKFRKGINGA